MNLIESECESMEADDGIEYWIAGEITKNCHEIWKKIIKNRIN